MASKPWWSVGLSGGGQGSDGPNGGPTKPPASTGGGETTTTTTQNAAPAKGSKMPKWLEDYYKYGRGAMPPAATGYQGGTMPAGGGMNNGGNPYTNIGSNYSPVNVGGLTGYVPFTARGQTAVPSWLQGAYGNMLLGPWDYGLNPYGAGIFNNYGQPIGTPAPANNKRVTNRQWNFFQHGGMNPDKVTRWVGPYKTPGAGVPHWGGGNGGGGGGGGKNKSTGWQEGINQLAL